MNIITKKIKKKLLKLDWKTWDLEIKQRVQDARFNQLIQDPKLDHIIIHIPNIDIREQVCDFVEDIPSEENYIPEGHQNHWEHLAVMI